MLKELINLANELDQRNLRKEADYLDLLLTKYAMEPVSIMAAINAYALSTTGSGLASVYLAIETFGASLTGTTLVEALAAANSFGTPAGQAIARALTSAAPEAAVTASETVAASTGGLAAYWASLGGWAGIGSGALAGGGTATSLGIATTAPAWFVGGLIAVGVAAALGTAWHGWKWYSESSERRTKNTGAAVINAIRIPLGASLGRRQRNVDNGWLDKSLDDDKKAANAWGKDPSNDENVKAVYNAFLNISKEEWGMTSLEAGISEGAREYIDIDEARKKYDEIVRPLEESAE